jgi:serine/threonine protein kinase/tetratricopeptide (TPR) repeat protein
MAEPSATNWRDSTDHLAFGWEIADEQRTGSSAQSAGDGMPGGLAPSRFAPDLDRLSLADSNRSLAAFSLHLDPRSVAARGGPSAPGPTRARTASGSSSAEVIPFPKLGDVLAGFRIINELGRGAFGRVYLAEQADLYDRPVALKVSKALGDEPRNLSRLQHTHIMPIHSLHDDPATGLRLMCMPYVGGANLAQVLDLAGARLPVQASGRSLVEALDQAGGPLSAAVGASRLRTSASRFRSRSRTTAEGAAAALVSKAAGGRAVTRGYGSPSTVRARWGRYLARLPWWRELDPGADPVLDDDREPARRFLRSATYVQASVWIGARLAEALQHAHERGLLHRDLKPSNVLIAADGTPMLLDFNLSAEIKAPGGDEDAHALMGGTLPYMAPEHLDAFHPHGTTPEEAVDERADIYSLGLILFEMIAGQHPFADPPAGLRMADALDALLLERRKPAPSARAINPQVPWSLESIVRKCLDPDPDKRYRSAGALAEDLRLFLEDKPLKHAPELSVRERIAKWCTRHPRASSGSTIGAVAAVAVIGLGMAAWSLSAHLEASSARLRRSAFRTAFNECQLLLNTSTGPVEHIGTGLELAAKTLGAYGVDGPGDWTAGGLVRSLPGPEREALFEEVSELVQLRARAIVHRAAKGSPEDRRHAYEEALTWLDGALRYDPRPSAALYADRARYETALGQAEQAARDQHKASETPPRSARDWYLLGTSELAQGQADRAERDLGRAAALDPRRFWAWFALGLCHYQQGRFAESAGDFAACTALYPEFAWPHQNRGLALAAANRLPEARAAYDRALVANPNFIEALVNRALTCLELDDAHQAERDLARAIALGHRDPSVQAARAEALARLGRRNEALQQFNLAIQRRPRDASLLVARGFFQLRSAPALARADFMQAIELNPIEARAHLGLAYVLRPHDPRAALAELNAALRVSADFGDALQLRALIRARLGDHEAEADAEQLARVPSPQRLYNAACALALLARTSGQPRHVERALTLLRRAVDVGWPRAKIGDDPDFAAIRDVPEFQALLAEPGPGSG